tara:strand:- start:645 stop:800 length:156 start_codon:yes stop_codon:yes gene_type:complete
MSNETLSKQYSEKGTVKFYTKIEKCQWVWFVGAVIFGSAVGSFIGVCLGYY